MTIITSPSNPKVHKLKDLYTSRGRKANGLFLMEGLHLLEMLLDIRLFPREVYYQTSYLQRTVKGKALLARLLHEPKITDEQRIEVSERVIEAIGDAVTSQGVVSVLALTDFQIASTRERRNNFSSTTQEIFRPTLLVLDDIADPGNMGTILRTALATDVDAVLLTPNCVDCYSPKVVRSAAGAHLLLPIEKDVTWETVATRIQHHGGADTPVLLAEAGSTTLYYEQDLKQPFTLIIGNEAHGPSHEARSLSTTNITIPLANNVESLNAAMAAGIILYEAVRQSAKQY